jgi:UDP-N-acetylmuramoyl-tripeptide--D-alanyl-D-alanine ligase
MPAGATAVVPAGEPLLEPHLRDDVDTVTFGAGGDVELAADEGERLEIKMGEERVSVTFPLVQAHHRANLLAALAAARAVGVDPPARIDVALSAGRGRRHRTPEGVVVIDDCYNANPMSMRAALDDLARHEGRRVAVLGDMLELGPDELRFHREIGEHAARSGVDELVAVGPLSAAVLEGYEQAGGQEARSVPEAAAAAAAVPGLVRPGDAVLVKASRGVGLEAVVDALG